MSKILQINRAFIIDMRPADDIVVKPYGLNPEFALEDGIRQINRFKDEGQMKDEGEKIINYEL